MIDSIALFILLILFTGYRWLKSRYQHWEKRRVPYLKPNSLFFGNQYEFVMGQLSLAETCLKHYKGLAPHKFGGVYHYYKPMLCVRDPELVKHIMIKDFNHFSDRESFMATKDDPLTQNLFHLGGEEWRVLRQKLSPTFTSGKMKMLLALMKECAGKLEKIVEKNAHDHETVEVKDLNARYTTDVISSCAFGLETDSLNNPDSEFRVRGNEIFVPTWRNQLREALFWLSPTLTHFLRFGLFPPQTTKFFMSLVTDTIEFRNRNGIVRNDLLNLLMNLQKEEKAKNCDLSLELLAAQCFIFFVAGFETSSSALSFIMYELAENPDIQAKLQSDIDHVLQKHQGVITYECLQEMHYMEKVFNETSRLFPALSILPRFCTKDYRLPDSDYVMKKGEMLFIPVYGLHRDPQYYPNPDVFNPENFSEEAKATRPACSFLPFGDGPRNCIGNRFAILQVKLALTTILRKHTITLSPKMKRPMELLPNSFLTLSKNDILLIFNKRELAEN